MGEEVSELAYGSELFTVDGFWSVFDCTGEKVESMDDPIACGYCVLSKIIM